MIMRVCWLGEAFPPVLLTASVAPAAGADALVAAGAAVAAGALRAALSCGAESPELGVAPPAHPLNITDMNNAIPIPKRLLIGVIVVTPADVFTQL